MNEQDPLFDLPEPPPKEKPKPRTNKLLTVPLDADATLERCRFCNRLVWKWGVTANGKRVPVDHTGGAQLEGVSHWMTCRKREKARAYFSKG